MKAFLFVGLTFTRCFLKVFCANEDVKQQGERIFSNISDTPKYTLKYLQHVRKNLAKLSVEHENLVVKADADFVMPILFTVQDNRLRHLYRQINQAYQESIIHYTYSKVDSVRDDSGVRDAKAFGEHISRTSSIIDLELKRSSFVSTLPNNAGRREESLEQASRFGLEVLTFLYEGWEYIKCISSMNEEISDKKDETKAQTSHYSELLSTDVLMIPRQYNLKNTNLNAKYAIPSTVHLCIKSAFVANWYHRALLSSIGKQTKETSIYKMPFDGTVDHRCLDKLGMMSEVGPGTKYAMPSHIVVFNNMRETFELPSKVAVVNRQESKTFSEIKHKQTEYAVYQADGWKEFEKTADLTEKSFNLLPVILFKRALSLRPKMIQFTKKSLKQSSVIDQLDWKFVGELAAKWKIGYHQHTKDVNYLSLLRAALGEKLLAKARRKSKYPDTFKIRAPQDMHLPVHFVAKENFYKLNKTKDITYYYEWMHPELYANENTDSCIFSRTDADTEWYCQQAIILAHLPQPYSTLSSCPDRKETLEELAFKHDRFAAINELLRFMIKSNGMSKVEIQESLVEICLESRFIANVLQNFYLLPADHELYLLPGITLIEEKQVRFNKYDSSLTMVNKLSDVSIQEYLLIERTNNHAQIAETIVIGKHTFTRIYENRPRKSVMRKGEKFPGIFLYKKVNKTQRPTIQSIQEEKQEEQGDCKVHSSNIQIISSEK